MALPPGITPKTVTVGVASFFDGGLAEGRVTITAPVNVVHTPTNRPIFSSQMSVPFVDGEAAFNLCPTDADGLNRVNWTYKMNVVVKGALVQPDPIYFILPAAGPDEVDLDALVPVPSNAGIPVSVDVLTPVDLQGYATIPATDAEREAFVPDRLSDVELRAALGAVAQREALALQGRADFDLGAAYADNAAAAQVTPTYDGSGQAVHPSVQFYPQGWNGFRYWMAMTPYPNGVDTTENPSILCSNDGVTWAVPAGLTNPIDSPPTAGFYPDPDLIDIDGTLWCVYNANLAKFSTTGSTWSARQTLTGVASTGVVSPTLIRNGNEIWYWAVDTAASPNVLKFYKSASGNVTGPYGAPVACTINNMPASRDVWHVQVRRSGDLLIGVFTLADAGTSGTNTELRLATSQDGGTWDMQSAPLLAKSPAGWDNKQIYRAAIVPYDGRDGVLAGLWYSAASSSQQWRIGFTKIMAGTLTADTAKLSRYNKHTVGQTTTGSTKNRLTSPLTQSVGAEIAPAGWNNAMAGATGQDWDEAREAYTVTSAGSGNIYTIQAGTFVEGQPWTFSVEAMAAVEGSRERAALLWQDGAGAAIGAAVGGAEAKVGPNAFTRVFVTATAPAGAVTARLILTSSDLVRYWLRRAQFEQAAAPTAFEPRPATVTRAALGQTGDIAQWQTALGSGKGARVGFAVNASGRPRLENLTATPTDTAAVDELCAVNGVLYICTVAGTPGTWVKVGTQT